jgi:hypothetical protein
MERREKINCNQFIVYFWKITWLPDSFHLFSFLYIYYRGLSPDQSNFESLIPYTVPLPFDFHPLPGAVVKLRVEHVLTCAGSGLAGVLLSGPPSLHHPCILFCLIDSISRWVGVYVFLSDGWEKIHDISIRLNFCGVPKLYSCMSVDLNY